MDVYLDAVFFPNFKTNPQILEQEGWHYHLENKEDDLIIRGLFIMRWRVFSSPESSLFRLLFFKTLPQHYLRTLLRGRPESIVSLEQEASVAFHDKYYHPSNSKSILYGDLDIIEALKLLDSYFSEFTKQDIEFNSYEPKAYTEEKKITDFYPLIDGENEENKTYFCYGYHVGNALDPEFLWHATSWRYLTWF